MEIFSCYGFSISGFNFISHESFRCLEKRFPTFKVSKSNGVLLSLSFQIPISPEVSKLH